MPIAFAWRRSCLAWLYALWLNGMTYVFYVVGSASIGVEIVLLTGIFPAIAQVLVVGLSKRGSQLGITFSCLFILVILISYLGNIESWLGFVYLFNMAFVFCIALVIAACAEERMIADVTASYAVLGAILLLFVNLTGEFVWGRLAAGGIQPNFWGLIAVSVGASAIGLRNRLLMGICWSTALLTLYNASSRGSMVALAACFIVLVGHWLIRTRRKGPSWALLGAGAIICILVVELNPLPQLTAFVSEGLLKIDDPYRGSGTGLTGRTAAWAEALEIWMESPLFGVGFRQHESMITAASSAHSGYLAMLVDTGIFGLAAYLALIGYSLFAALRRIEEPKIQQAVLAIIVSYMVLGLFDRRGLNSGNPFSILFVIACFYALRARIGRISHSRIVQNSEFLLGAVRQDMRSDGYEQKREVRFKGPKLRRQTSEGRISERYRRHRSSVEEE